MIVVENLESQKYQFLNFPYINTLRHFSDPRYKDQSSI